MMYVAGGYHDNVYKKIFKSQSNHEVGHLANYWPFYKACVE